MKSIKIAFLSFLACSAVTSCNFLEKEPYELTPETYFNSESEVSSFLTSVYSPLAGQNFYGNYYMYLNGADDLSHYGGGRNPESSGCIACNNATVSSPMFSALWITLYSGIDRASTLLENVENMSSDILSDDAKKQYTAEARFLRAFYYFTLVQGWGDVPFKTTSTSSVNGLDIPRTDKNTIYDFITSEMEDAAENGLKSAAELSYLPGHVSKSAAWGILARVYMFRAGEHFRDNTTADEAKIKEYFTKADTYAKKVMGEGHSLAANYWDVFVDLCSGTYNTTANESIWEVEFEGDYSGETRSEGRIGNLIGLQAPRIDNTSLFGAQDPGYCYSMIRTTPKLYELYVANGDKERMNWNIAPFTYVSTTSTGVTGRKFFPGKMDEVKSETPSWWDKSYTYGSGDTQLTNSDSSAKNYSRSCGKYRREFETQNSKKNANYTSINFPLLRYSDVLLMVAESENEINEAPTSLAYECLNAVRERAGIEAYTAATLAEKYNKGSEKENFRQAVKDERGMELCFEYTRRYDLIRWGEYVTDLNELASRAQQGNDGNWGGGNQYSVWTFFQISDAYNYFPIPDSEMSVNKAITKNNPGW